ncbi:WXG100-like domain-containing protein, partial [Actinopolyspora mortivallis]
MSRLGIELPAELREVAERTGTHWPEADEDAMREAARAWRAAAESLAALARASDASAQRALAAFEGEASRAARREWDGFVDPDSGRLPVCVRECTAAADRLEHAAGQVGAAKVRIVRELVALAKHLDVAENTTAGPVAEAEVRALTDATATNVAELNHTLVRAVDREGGVTVEAVDSPLSGRAGAEGGVPDPGVPEAVRGDLEAPSSAGADHPAGAAAVRTVGEAAGSPPEVPSPESPAEETGVQPPLVRDDQARPAPAEAAEQAPAAGFDRSPESPVRETTGPVAPETVQAAEQGRDEADPDTGPIPAVGGRGGAPSGGDPRTTPGAMHQAWAAPQPSEAAPAPRAGGPVG